MSQIVLSYVLTTRNKLPFLKHVLGLLMDNVQSDEEIVVVDGASTDGSVEFLNNLYQQGKIHQFLSEHDQCESHGFNKGCFLARGELIKLITDDDFFNYPAILDCKEFMRNNPRIDLMIGNVCTAPVENFDEVKCEEQVKSNYDKWLKDRTPFPFTGLSLMVRKASLSLTGLFYCNTPYPDTEFSLRVTGINTQIAWCNAIISVRIENSKSVFRLSGEQRSKEEIERFFYFYVPRYRIRMERLAYVAGQKVKKVIRIFNRLLQSKEQPHLGNEGVCESNENIGSIYKKCSEYVDQYSDEPTIISSSPPAALKNEPCLV